MARRNTKKTDDRDWTADYADGGIEYLDFDDELLNSMKSYIDYQLTERALPYIDGLKPVHRAILWCMWDKKLYSSNQRKKSLAVSGDVVGRAHPHSGDAVYGAIAGMTRSNADDARCGACGLNLSLIDGKGNWGAEFADKVASARYTEIRLSKSGEACVRDTTSGAVFMNPTFDAEWVLPEVLPVRLPLLLINGSYGIAYGYSVQWLPHNPSEAIAAVLMRLDNPKCTVKDIRSVMPGPDFPSGGIIVDSEENGIEAGYATGKGSMSVTSRYTIEKSGRHSIIRFYETPYLAPRSGTGDKKDNKDKKKAPSIVIGISKFSEEHPEYGIVDVKNLSDKDHECLVEVSVKSSVNAEAVAAALVNATSKTRLTDPMPYRQSAVIGEYVESPVPDASGVENVLRLTNLHPQDLSLFDYIDEFIKFRCSCVVNAARSEKRELADKKHKYDGMVKALLDIDTVIAVIRSSDGDKEARANLMKKLKLTEVQADYVLARRLSTLTRSDRLDIETKAKQTAARIKEIDKLLSSAKNVKAEVRRQLEELAAAQTLPRRTTIISAKGKVLAKAAGESREETAAAKKIASYVQGGKIDAGAAAQASEDDDAPSLTLEVEGSANVFLTPDGKLCRTARKDMDHVQKAMDIDLHSVLLLAFEDGSSLRTHVHELPDKPSIVMRKCVGFMDLGKEGDLTDKFMALATSDGIVKVLKCDTLTKAEECPIMSLSTNAKLMSARPCDDSTFFVFIASNANLLRFPTSSVNPQGRTSGGVAGIKLVDDASVVYATVASEGDMLVTLTPQSIKQTPLAEYPTKGRGSQGVRCHKFLKGEDSLVQAFIAEKPVAKGAKLPEPAARDASGTKADGLDKVSFSNG